jgi:hypothetical protein
MQIVQLGGQRCKVSHRDEEFFSHPRTHPGGMGQKGAALWAGGTCENTTCRVCALDPSRPRLLRSAHSMCVCVSVCVRGCVCVYICIHTHNHTHTHTYIQNTYIHAYMHKYIHPYIHTHTHTHTHTHIHATYVYKCIHILRRCGYRRRRANQTAAPTFLEPVRVYFKRNASTWKGTLS